MSAFPESGRSDHAEYDISEGPLSATSGYPAQMHCADKPTLNFPDRHNETPRNLLRYLRRDYRANVFED